VAQVRCKKKKLEPAQGLVPAAEVGGILLPCRMKRRQPNVHALAVRGRWVWAWACGRNVDACGLSISPWAIVHGPLSCCLVFRLPSSDFRLPSSLCVSPFGGSPLASPPLPAVWLSCSGPGQPVAIASPPGFSSQTPHLALIPTKFPIRIRKSRGRLVLGVGPQGSAAYW
jgi:hypothetical protein